MNDVFFTSLQIQGCHLKIGPVSFKSDNQGMIGAALDGEFNQELILDALHLLYFAHNGYKIYNGIKPDPLTAYLSASFTPFPFKEKGADPALLETFDRLMHLKVDKSGEAERIICAIKCFNETMLESSLNLPIQPWKQFLLLASGFEVLFSLKRSFPAADLRQHLRPILHLKFSHPVELLWIWVDRFYELQEATLKGSSHIDSFFTENSNVKSPVILIGKKLFIYSIYELLYTKDLLKGTRGTETTPDDFTYIHPERILVYFWTLNTIERKKILLNHQPVGENEAKMLSKIEEMHASLQKILPDAASEEFFIP